MSRGGFQVSSSLRMTPGSLEPEWYHSVVPLEAQGPMVIGQGQGARHQALRQGHLSEAASAGGGDGPTSLEGRWGAALLREVSLAPRGDFKCGAGDRVS